MSWINVEEQLPATSDDVLAFSESEGSFRAWFENNVWLSHETSNDSIPTHWMQLPPAPQQVVKNGPSAFGMTDNLVSSNTRPYSVWSESIETAKDIKIAWEDRFGGPYELIESNRGYIVKYVGEWQEEKQTASS